MSRHITPRRKIGAPETALELWDAAAERDGADTWSDWARQTLTVAAAETLGIDPVVALQVLHGRDVLGKK